MLQTILNTLGFNRIETKFIEGEVLDIKKYNYYYCATLNINSNIITYRIYDTIGELFYKTINKGDFIQGYCEYNLTDYKNNTYNKLKTFNKLNNFIVNKESNKTTLLFNGIITNTANTRDKKQDNEIAFCFKPKNGKKVYFIIGNDTLEYSQFFYKNSKVSVELLPEQRNINFPNPTYRLISLWKDN